MDNIPMDSEELMEESLDKIYEWLDEKKYFQARDELLKFNSVDIAEMLEEICEEKDIDMTIILFRLLHKDISVEVFAELSSDTQVNIINAITDKELDYIVSELDFDDKIDVLEELPANIVSQILENTPKNERKLINTFLNYPDTCAGSLMTPDYISLNKNWTVQRALEHIKEEGMDAETVYTCYVKDSGRKLIGIVSLSTLVISDNDTKIKDIMVTDYVFENVYDDQEDVSEDFKKYGFLAMPVVDNEHRLVGIITVDDILDVMEEEATEDIERMNGVIDWENSDKGYLDMSVWQHAINRLPWLLILMIAYIFTGMIITSFEGRLSQIICLVAYMPMLMGTGGNTGSQAATLIIRGLATNEVDTSDVLKVLWKEFRIGILVGSVLSVVNFGRVCLLDGNSPAIALTVCTAMLLIVVFAKILGSMVPLIVKKMNLDPALIANPAISSVSDMVALTIYFAMASVFLHL
ncbi:MAG: magnesium transporter [Clostridia bacterium]|nr:magnesium transporter [Clostridia bacterium]MDO5303101.1 magnesium transporter [Clostridia bacterium]